VSPFILLAEIMEAPECLAYFNREMAREMRRRRIKP
jgi:hypothetical protein